VCEKNKLKEDSKREKREELRKGNNYNYFL